MRRTTDKSKLADDGGQILKFHMQTYHPHYDGICRLFTWKRPNAPVQRTSLVQLSVPGTGRSFPMPHLAGSTAAVAGRKALEQKGELITPRTIYLEGQTTLPDGSSEGVGLHGALLPIAELLQVWSGHLQVFTLCTSVF